MSEIGATKFVFRRSLTWSWPKGVFSKFGAVNLVDITLTWRKDVWLSEMGAINCDAALAWLVTVLFSAVGSSKLFGCLDSCSETVSVVGSSKLFGCLDSCSEAVLFSGDLGNCTKWTLGETRCNLKRSEVQSLVVQSFCEV